MEAGVNLDGVSCQSFADISSIPKGVIWLFIATIAEVTPVASLANFVALPLFSSIRCRCLSHWI